ncbi:MAG: ABC transporter permease [Planctomycetes bacterium]|nr:ABC transporter permease [Planctomycetota bacterium]
MKLLAYIIAEAFSSLQRERRRLFPMTLGITWGMASVMVLLAVAAGFEASQRKALSAYGDRFIYLRLNRGELDRSAGEERRLMMDTLDLERLRQGAPAIRRLTPMNMAYRARITGRSGAGTDVLIAGALPEITRIRNLPIEEGRFFDEIDQEEGRRVIVLGPMARKQLFGGGKAVGRSVRIAGFSRAAIPPPNSPRVISEAMRRGSAPAPAGSSSSSSSSSGSRSSSSFGSTPVLSTVSRLERDARATANPALGIGSEIFEVIGVLKDVEIQRESYVSVARLAFVPFSTSIQVFDKDFSTMIIEPRSIEEHDLALEQFRGVMGARYGFDPNDRNAVVIYFDSIERARAIGRIFGSLRLFLSAVGAAILAIGAIGVMNVVLVSVSARKFEIGLRKALGATPLAIYFQFFTETVLGCFLSGSLGFFIGVLGVAFLGSIPLPEGFSRPILDFRATSLAFCLLAAIAIAAGVYPASRAARLPPVVALRARG